MTDPIALQEQLWPRVKLADYQYDIVRSVWEDDETFVVAGNMLGKDFVAALIVLLFFLTRSPCRVVTTSAKENHLDVLWAEMKQLIETAAQPLDVDQGGCLLVLHREIRRKIKGKECLEFLGFLNPEKAVEGPILKTEETGIKHVSLAVDNMEEICKKLKNVGVEFTTLLPERAAFKDPQGVTIELRLNKEG